MTGISRESERMSLLVEDLLLLARLDEGRPLEREPRRARRGRRARPSRRRRASSPSGRSTVELEQATVIGDRDRLRQIVDNLLANVRAHTPPATPRRASRPPRRTARAVIAVTDSGPGLDEEQLDHVFERFYRTDASRARASGGVGLGLSIVAAVAEAHGGSVSARSAPGGARRSGSSCRSPGPDNASSRTARTALAARLTADSQPVHRAAPERRGAMG